MAGNGAVKLVVGPALTAFYDAAKGSFEKSRKPNCQPAVATGDFSGLKYGFRSQDPFKLDAALVVDWLKKEGVTSLGLVYEGDDTGKNTDALMKELLPRRIEYLGWETSRPDDQSHRAYVEKLNDAGRSWCPAVPAAPRRWRPRRRLATGARSSAPDPVCRTSPSSRPRETRPTAPSSRSALPVPDARAARGVDARIPPAHRGDRVRVRQERRPEDRATSPKGAAIAADCVFAFEQAVKSTKSTDPNKLAAAFEALDVPAERTPSGNAIKPGASHEFYHRVHLYQWSKDGKGWYTTEITPS